jgi:hypothetical protein
MPTQPPIQWVPGILYQGIKRGRGVTLTTHPHLVPRSMSCTTLPFVACMAVAGQVLLDPTEQVPPTVPDDCHFLRHFETKQMISKPKIIEICNDGSYCAREKQLQSTDHELIPARNASLAAVQGSASGSSVRYYPTWKHSSLRKKWIRLITMLPNCPMFAGRLWITTSPYRWPIGSLLSTCMLCTPPALH